MKKVPPSIYNTLFTEFGLTDEDAAYFADLYRHADEFDGLMGEKVSVLGKPRSELSPSDQPRSRIIDKGSTRDSINVDNVDTTLTELGFRRK